MGIVQTYKKLQSSISPYIDLARPYNSTAALLSFACGYCFYKPSVGWFNILVGLTVVALIHSAFTMQNDLYDLDVDTANKRKTPLTTGLIKAGGLRQIILNTVLAALAISWFGSQRLAGLGFIFAYSGLAWIYNAPPLRGSRRPILSIALLGPLYAFIPLLFGLWASGNELTGRFVIFAFLMTLTRISISILKDFKDSKGDKAHHKQTFYLRYGRKPVVLISSSLALAGYPLIVLSILFNQDVRGIFSSLLVLAAIASTAYRLKLWGAAGEKQLSHVFRNSFVIENYFEGVILLCLLAS